jgi:hypothetical protein
MATSDVDMKFNIDWHPRCRLVRYAKLNFVALLQLRFILRRIDFNHKLVHERFVVDKVAL